MGPEVVQPLGFELDEQNWSEGLAILEQADPYWYWHDNSGVLFYKLAETRKLEQRLLNSTSVTLSVEILGELQKSPYGMIALDSIESTFLEVVKSEDRGNGMASDWIRAIVTLDPTGDLVLKRLLTSTEDRVVHAVRSSFIFGKIINPTQILTKLIQAPEQNIRIIALDIFKRLGEKASPAFVPILHCLLQDEREAALAAKVLKGFGGKVDVGNGVRLMLEQFPKSNWEIRNRLLPVLSIILNKQTEREDAALLLLPWLDRRTTLEHRQAVEKMFSSVRKEGADKLETLVHAPHSFISPVDALGELPVLSPTEVQVLAVRGIRLVYSWSGASLQYDTLLEPRFLNHPKREVRQAVLTALKEMGIDSAEVIGRKPEEQNRYKVLQQLRQETDPNLKAQIAWLALKHWNDFELKQEIETLSKTIPNFSPLAPPEF